MRPDTFNRIVNPSKEDFDRFVGWLFSTTLAEAKAARGDMEATRAVWVQYFRRGLRADLLLDELGKMLPELFIRAQYSPDERPRILQMIKEINFEDLGITKTDNGIRFDYERQ